MTVTEAAEHYGVDAATIWEWVSSGRLVAERDSDAEPWRIREPAQREAQG